MKDFPELKMIVVYHKACQIPEEDMYLPFRLNLMRGMERESSPENAGFYYSEEIAGENISDLQDSFCELTGLYWGWKNLDADYIGLVHYRRYFRGKKRKDPFESILKYEDIKESLGKKKVFLPRKQHYYIETLYSHYAHTHYPEHLDITRKILAEKYPEYLPSCDKVYRQRSGYMFNILIMEKNVLNEYCTWLFDLLFDLKDQIPTEGLSQYQKRIFGRISEILLNIWIDYQKETDSIQKNEIQELPIVYLEKRNWAKKISAFLKAKFFGKKYTESF